MEVVIEELDKRMNKDKSRATATLAENGTKNVKTEIYFSKEPINVMNQ